MLKLIVVMLAAGLGLLNAQTGAKATQIKEAAAPGYKVILIQPDGRGVVADIDAATLTVVTGGVRPVLKAIAPAPVVNPITVSLVVNRTAYKNASQTYPVPPNTPKQMVKVYRNGLVQKEQDADGGDYTYAPATGTVSFLPVSTILPTDDVIVEATSIVVTQ